MTRNEAICTASKLLSMAYKAGDNDILTWMPEYLYNIEDIKVKIAAVAIIMSGMYVRGYHRGHDMYDPVDFHMSTIHGYAEALSLWEDASYIVYGGRPLKVPFYILNGVRTVPYTVALF